MRVDKCTRRLADSFVICRDRVMTACGAGDNNDKSGKNVAKTGYSTSLACPRLQLADNTDLAIKSMRPLVMLPFNSATTLTGGSINTANGGSSGSSYQSFVWRGN